MEPTSILSQFCISANFHLEATKSPETSGLPHQSRPASTAKGSCPRVAAFDPAQGARKFRWYSSQGDFGQNPNQVGVFACSNVADCHQLEYQHSASESQNRLSFAVWVGAGDLVVPGRAANKSLALMATALLNLGTGVGAR